jgi:tetratricopeptide (TPR) repeat protein
MSNEPSMLLGFLLLEETVMNTKIYKRVLSLAESLLKAANKKDQITFDALYSELNAICLEHEGDEKDHPVQWETLADFTDDIKKATEIYRTALEKAEMIESADFCSSIRFSLASMLIELGKTEEAIEVLREAKVVSANIEDKALKNEIHDLLQSLIN